MHCPNICPGNFDSSPNDEIDLMYMGLLSINIFPDLFHHLGSVETWGLVNRLISTYFRVVSQQTANVEENISPLWLRTSDKVLQ